MNKRKPPPRDKKPADTQGTKRTEPNVTRTETTTGDLDTSDRTSHVLENTTSHPDIPQADETGQGETAGNSGPDQHETPHLKDTTASNRAGNVSLDGAEPELPQESSVAPVPSRARMPGESRPSYWESMRKTARAAGLPRGQGPGSAYEWATLQAEREYAAEREELEPVEGSPPVELDPPEAIESVAVPAAAPVPADQGVLGLGDLPSIWPTLPANASLQVEIAWVSANRLRVRDGNGVDLSRALSPAPSYSALSWLETSILFPSKFADISVKATANQDEEKEQIRREKMSIEEMRGILAEMLPGPPCPMCGQATPSDWERSQA